MRKKETKKPSFRSTTYRTGFKVLKMSTEQFDYEIGADPVKFGGKYVTENKKRYYSVVLLRSKKGKGNFTLIESAYVLGSSQRDSYIKKYEKKALKDSRMRTLGF